MDGKPTTMPLTVATALRLRAKAEADVLAILAELQRATNMDFLGIKAHVQIEVDADDEPRHVPVAVRIDLAV